MRIAIIGAGPGGLCMGKRLLDEDFNDFVILERAEDVGGTWYVNRYPGSECDTPAVLYSFTFEQYHKWSKKYPKQPEILDYLRHIADKFNLRPHCRFGYGVTHAKWRTSTSTWLLTLDSGEKIEAEIVVSAVGSEPHYPDIDGIDTFKGVFLHSSQLDSDHDFSGEKVAIIGSNAGAIQLVPQVVKRAPQVYLFQRTPVHVLPKHDEPESPRKYKAALADPKLYSQMRDNVEQEVNGNLSFSDPKKLIAFENEALSAIAVVKDPKVREKLYPKFSFGLRLPSLSNTYYRAFNERNLELVDCPIVQITEHNILTMDGTTRQIDMIIAATGFETAKCMSSIDVKGTNGLSITRVRDKYTMSYLDMMTAGFPNLFMIVGRNINTGSIPTLIEAQVDYIITHLLRMLNNNLIQVEVTEAAMQRYNSQIRAISGAKYFHRAVFSNNSNFQADTISPITITEYQRLVRTINKGDFLVLPKTKSKQKTERKKII